jgi:hypothetical protein
MKIHPSTTPMGPFFLFSFLSFPLPFEPIHGGQNHCGFTTLGFIAFHLSSHVVNVFFLNKEKGLMGVVKECHGY